MISPTTLENLNPWPENPRRHVDVGRAGQRVYEEVLVGGVGEHARSQRHRWAVGVGEIAGDGLPQHRLVLVTTLPVEPIGGRRLVEVVELADLEPRDAEHGRRVVLPLLELADDDGEGVGREHLRAQRLEPAEDLPLRRQQVVQRRHERPRPCAGGNDQRTRLVRPTGGLGAHRVARRVPLQHRLAGPHVGAALQRDGHVRDNAPFRHEEPAVRLVQARPLLREPAAGEPLG